MSHCSHWNYRVIREKGSFTIHEVYYDDEGKIHAWSADAIAALGDTLTELDADLRLMLSALRKPVLRKSGKRLVEVQP